MARIVTIIGTRPEIIKMAPVIEALQRRAAQLIVVHSGQHYDFEMSEVLFKQLNLPKPDMNLEVGSGTHSRHLARLLTSFERMIRRFQPDLVLAEGDTNTVAAGGLACSRSLVPFGHVEAGLRSYDRTMPEEMNRMLADDCAELCFAPTQRAAINLCREGISPAKIRVTGNTIVDACLKNLQIARRRSRMREELAGEDLPIVTVTIHRAENVDNVSRLRTIVSILLSLKKCKIVYPIHPRTRIRLLRNNLLSRLKKAKNLIITPPLAYWDFLSLLSSSKAVLTDSGGVQEEALVLNVPCLTLRTNTERPETVDAGMNFIVGTDNNRILPLVNKALQGRLILKPHARNVLGDGRAGERIAETCMSSLEKHLRPRPPEYYESGSASYKIIGASGRIVGKSVEDLIREHPDVLLSTVFDSEGNPLFPYPELTIGRGWKIQIFGEAATVNRISEF